MVLTERCLRALQGRLLWLLMLGYMVAAFVPRPGILLRDISFGTLHLSGGGSMKIGLPLAMLAFLLLNAGLGAELGELGRVLRRPWMLLAGLVANSAVPLILVGIVAVMLRGWRDVDEAQSILVGIALVGSMPIAGASTAWAQNCKGDLALSLGLVVASTVLSPFLTPITLHAVAYITAGDYSVDLHAIATRGSGAFVIVSVVAPSAVGIAVRAALGSARLARVIPTLKLLNLLNLVLLSYTNACVALPQALRTPDWDFLALGVAVATVLCALAFTAGWQLARRFGGSPAEQISMMFGLGMNNNGAGLVLASMALADHPIVMLPLIFYNLAQQLIAGVVDAHVRRRRNPDHGTASAVAE